MAPATEVVAKKVLDLDQGARMLGKSSPWMPSGVIIKPGMILSVTRARPRWDPVMGDLLVFAVYLLLKYARARFLHTFCARITQVHTVGAPKWLPECRFSRFRTASS